MAKVVGAIIDAGRAWPEPSPRGVTGAAAELSNNRPSGRAPAGAIEAAGFWIGAELSPVGALKRRFGCARADAGAESRPPGIGRDADDVEGTGGAEVGGALNNRVGVGCAVREGNAEGRALGTVGGVAAGSPSAVDDVGAPFSNRIPSGRWVSLPSSVAACEEGAQTRAVVTVSKDAASRRDIARERKKRAIVPTRLPDGTASPCPTLSQLQTASRRQAALECCQTVRGRRRYPKRNTARSR